MQPDILVVGGGPAGLASAIAAAQKVSASPSSIPENLPSISHVAKACFRRPLRRCAALEFIFSPATDFRFEGFRFSDETVFRQRTHSARAGPWIAPHCPSSAADRSRKRSGSFADVGRAHFGSRFRRRLRRRQFVPCSWLIGADGQNSVVRRFAGLGPCRSDRSAASVSAATTPSRPGPISCEVHWGRIADGCLAHAGNEICVSLFVDDSRMRIDRALLQFPEVARRLGGASPISAEAGALMSFRRARAVVRSNVALVGDAGCTVDAISGQGLSLAFQQARPSRRGARCGQSRELSSRARASDARPSASRACCW